MFADIGWTEMRVSMDRSDPNGGCGAQAKRCRRVSGRKRPVVDERSSLGFHRAWSVKWVLRGCRQEALCLSDRGNCLTHSDSPAVGGNKCVPALFICQRNKEKPFLKSANDLIGWQRPSLFALRQALRAAGRNVHAAHVLRVLKTFCPSRLHFLQVR